MCGRGAGEGGGGGGGVVGGSGDGGGVGGAGEDGLRFIAPEMASLFALRFCTASPRSRHLSRCVFSL